MQCLEHIVASSEAVFHSKLEAFLDYVNAKPSGRIISVQYSTTNPEINTVEYSALIHYEKAEPTMKQIQVFRGMYSTKFMEQVNEFLREIQGNSGEVLELHYTVSDSPEDAKPRHNLLIYYNTGEEAHHSREEHFLSYSPSAPMSQLL